MSNTTTNPQNRQLSVIPNFRLRGKYFDAIDISLIKSIIEQYYSKGRTYISRKVCEELDWRQPNGWLKDRACRDVLREFHRVEIIKLPPPKIIKKEKLCESSTKNQVINEATLSKTPLKSLDLSTIELVSAKGTSQEYFWNWIVNSYHYLGFKCFVGRSLKYLVYTENRVIGAIGFCAPAWTLSSRDNLFQQLDFTKNQVRERGINNGRFLILPWVNVPNLASRILSIAVKRAQVDWEKYYNVEPIYIETFVDPTKYLGTCYKASNWIQIGKTSGYRKCGSNHFNSQVPKDIYLYPLNKETQKILIYDKGK